ncbi:ABC transporter permease [Chitinophaga flava]|uniref:Transporter permease n=1 Tax=Chitinophaga flava TaxID=2259036 RepID=A0A365XY87_9BACT|nr:ABC transporter permease [Chitinophaga flava]RBL90664.1 transporter permease [Chitinophaga flava]
MLPNHIRLIWRALLKDRQFTLLNLLGLSTGLACTLLLLLWINDELQVDKYNVHDRQLYQVMLNTKSDEGIRTMPNTPGLLARSLKEEIPEITAAVSVLPASWFPYKGVISRGEQRLKAAGQYADSSYFDVFTCPLIAGHPSQVLRDKSSVVISEEMARRLFHTTDNVIGQTLKWDQQELGGLFTITGIFKNNPPSATQQFDLIFPYALVLERRPGLTQWGNNDPNTYVLLKNDADITQVDNKISRFIQGKTRRSDAQLFLSRFSDNYLYGKYENGVQAGGRIAYVKMFSVIAVLILLIACINFMNLSTAMASRRMKEIGVKKVLGASRMALVWQCIGEAIMMSAIASLLALLMVWLLLPVFNQLTAKQLQLHPGVPLILLMTGITVITGLIAGSYPALYLSGFRPVQALKGRFSTSFGELMVRKGLVVVQFTLSVAFIAAVLVIYKQLEYIQSRNLGYNRHQVIHFEIPLGMDSIQEHRAIAFINELRNIPGIVNASSYYHNLTGEHGAISDFQWPGKDPHTSIDFSNLEVGDRFLETAGIQLKEGRHFSDGPNARHEIIFNETAIKSMGLKDPVGKTITFWGQSKQIVGIAADFNFESLYQSIQPCFFQIYPAMPNVMVRLGNEDEKQTLAKVQQAFERFYPGMVFEHRYLDEDYQALYTAEQRTGTLSRYFAGMAIIISCLGLFGLTAFTAQRRQKEISIRKVVGASVCSVALLLSKDFLKLVLLALVLAFLLVSWGMSHWLNNFAYHVHLGVDVYLITMLTISIITLATVSYQAIKAAVANPVKNLRAE